MVRRVQAQLGLRDEALKALVDLIDDELPDALVGQEAERRIHDLAHRLEGQGATIPQYLEATGTTRDELLEGLKAEAVQSVKADLALRAVAEAEGIEVTDEDIDAEIERLAQRFEQKPAQLRRQLEQQEALPTVRSDVRKSKALEWLIDHVEVVDEEGQPIDRSQLEPPTAPEAQEVEAEATDEESETEA
jgi:trigger factor